MLQTAPRSETWSADKVHPGGLVSSDEASDARGSALVHDNTCVSGSFKGGTYHSEDHPVLGGNAKHVSWVILDQTK